MLASLRRTSLTTTIPHSELPRVAAVFLATLLFTVAPAVAQPADANYDESKVPDYRLPELLRLADGRPVTTPTMWRTERRPEILAAFRTQVYGRCPEPPGKLQYEVLSVDDEALDGKAIRKQVRVSVKGNDRWPGMEVLIYVPRNASKPVPAFLGLNFAGNQSIHADPSIRVTQSWMRNRPHQGVVEHRATEASRGVSASRWDLAEILRRGYGLVTIYCGDIDPDYDDGFENGVHALFARDDESGDEWGTISAWAWGLSRALDYLETDDDVNHHQVAVMGHSRLGKTALWAGARDERFAIVISNNSGCGGAALSRRQFGETVSRINGSFPHWFCSNFKQFNGNESELPVDQHQLVALVAPRPVYIASATGDAWADPRGEFLSAFHAQPVYELLLGSDALPTSEMPAADEPVMGTIGYHLRTGEHDVTSFDWKCYLDFADKHFGRN